MLSYFINAFYHKSTIYCYFSFFTICLGKLQFSKKRILLIFLEGKGGRKGEKHINVRRKLQPVASHRCLDWDQTHNPGMFSKWGSTRNRTISLLICGTVPNQLSHTSQGLSQFFNTYFTLP